MGVFKYIRNKNKDFVRGAKRLGDMQERAVRKVIPGNTRFEKVVAKKAGQLVNLQARVTTLPVRLIPLATEKNRIDKFDRGQDRLSRMPGGSVTSTITEIAAAPLTVPLRTKRTVDLQRKATASQLREEQDIANFLDEHRAETSSSTTTTTNTAGVGGGEGEETLAEQVREKAGDAANGAAEAFGFSAPEDETPEEAEERRQKVARNWVIVGLGALGVGLYSSSRRREQEYRRALDARR